jgi:gluconate 2-dehydrogenase gamma chain
MSRNITPRHNLRSSAILRKVNATTQKRRDFLRNMALLSAGSVIPFSACLRGQGDQIPKGRDPKILSEIEWNTLVAIQDVLFPSEENSPGARDVNAAGYFQWVISDPLLDPEEAAFRKNGIIWIEETAVENRNKSFVELDEEAKEKVLRYAENYSWGESWISATLLHIFEALLSDPIYGGNTDERGWKWLNYTPGIPRPTKGKIYLDYELSDGSYLQKKGK